ncbi:sll1863 family stress response protein [Desulfonatronum parangueonense]
MSEERDAYLKSLQSEIDKCNAEIDRLAYKVHQFEAEIKARYLQMEDYRNQRQSLENKISELQRSEDVPGDEATEGIETSWDSWMESFAKSKSEFQKGFHEGRTK